eukprot:3515751-Amphidinium_carterae.3
MTSLYMALAGGTDWFAAKAENQMPNNPARCKAAFGIVDYCDPTYLLYTWHVNNPVACIDVLPTHAEVLSDNNTLRCRQVCAGAVSVLAFPSSNQIPKETCCRMWVGLVEAPKDPNLPGMQQHALQKDSSDEYVCRLSVGTLVQSMCALVTAFCSYCHLIVDALFPTICNWHTLVLQRTRKLEGHPIGIDRSGAAFYASKSSRIVL